MHYLLKKTATVLSHYLDNFVHERKQKKKMKNMFECTVELVLKDQFTLVSLFTKRKTEGNKTFVTDNKRKY